MPGKMAPLFSPQPSIQVTDSSPATYLSPSNQTAGKKEGNMVSTSHLLGASPSGEYSYRAPSPPHIHVPQYPDDKVYTLTPHPNFPCNPAHRETLLQILNSNQQSASRQDWKYDHRRYAQPVLPFLFLGPSSSARDIEALKKEGITLLLVVRDASMVVSKFLSGEKVASQLGIESQAIDVTGGTQLIAAFPRAIDIINGHLVRVYQHRSQSGQESNTGKVLVFCESGNERSATVVAAYLMHVYGIDEVAAIQYVQTQRFCVAFDDALKHLLRAYADILRARSTVSQDFASSVNGNGLGVQSASRQRDVSTSRAKRGRDEVEDEDDDGMDVDADQRDDEERFGRRAAFTPFKDLSGL